MSRIPYTTYHDETQNYFNIEDILASQEKVPCSCETTLHRLGFLNPSNDGEHILPGTKLDLPLWLANGLHGRRRNIISVDLPKIYKASMREILSADPNVVDMHTKSPFFYAFGTKLLMFQHQESADVGKCLLETFVGRFRRIMDGSQNASHRDITRLTEYLSSIELSLFSAGQKSLQGYQNWENREITKITMSDMVVSHRKRKRAVMEEEEEES